jgi:hypothetical protein
VITQRAKVELWDKSKSQDFWGPRLYEPLEFQISGKASARSIGRALLKERASHVKIMGRQCAATELGRIVWVKTP